MTPFKDAIKDLIAAMLVNFDSAITSAVEVLTTDIFESAFAGTATAIAEVVAPVAASIAALCFMIEFLKCTVKADIIKWEYAVRMMCKLAIAASAIQVAPKLLKFIYITGAGWISGVGAVGAGEFGSSVYGHIETILSKMNWAQALGFAVSMLVAFLALFVAGILVHVMAYVRMFEILIHMAVSPIPCAFLPLEDSVFGAIPKKFVMSFTAAVMQGLFILISIVMFQALCSNIILTAMESATGMAGLTLVSSGMLLGSLVLVVAVMKSGAWAKSILGLG
ncbi:hypothetical protein AGMMS49975_17980 [Clostridia bacterium]|nr:hypothetical protein AGMMS49975_17980 [Clostridia bacterium]